MLMRMMLMGLFLSLRMESAELPKLNFIKIKSPEKFRESGRNTSLKMVSGIQGLNMSEPTFDPPSKIYDQIMKSIGQSYKKIGQDSVTQILGRNEQFNLGKINQSGLSWQRPFGSYGYAVNRILAPHLFSDKYVITDYLYLHVDAQTYLTNLSETGAIEVSDKVIALYAGLSFQRKFQYNHFADSYEDGLSKEFNKLFMSFLNFQGDSFLDLDENEYLSKEDSLVAAAGAYISLPLDYGLKLQAGGFVNYEKLSKVTISRPGGLEAGPKDVHTIISSTKSKTKTKNVSARLIWDFLKILELTLFSYDLEYEEKESKTVVMHIRDDSYNQLLSSKMQLTEMEKFVRKGKANYDILSKYLHKRKEEYVESKRKRREILLSGKYESSKTNELIIFDESEKKSFFEASYQKIKYTKSLFREAMKSLLKDTMFWLLFNPYDYSKTRKVSVEYNSDKERQTIETDKLSISLRNEFQAVRTTGHFSKGHKKKALNMIDQYTNLSKEVKQLVKTDVVRGPIRISAKLNVDGAGIDHFNSLSRKRALYIFEVLCKQTPRRNTSREIQRAERRQKSCNNKMRKDYDGYIESWHTTGEISLKRFKNLLNKVHELTDHKVIWQALFGEENIHFHGSFMGQLQGGGHFKKYFEHGEFRGLGVIDKYQRSLGLRAPASIDADLEM